MKKIVILHGWTYSLSKWDKFVKKLQKDGYETIVLRVPGLTAPSNRIWDLQKYSLWLKKRLSKEGDIILLGHSNGGRIAIYYLANFPNKVKKLVLIDSAGIYHNEFLLRTKRSVFGFIAKIGRPFVRSANLGKYLYKVIRQKDYWEAPENMKKTMKKLIYTDLTLKLSKIRTSTLIIWGEKDRITPPSDGQIMSQLIKNSKLKIINGAGHSPFYTHPEEVLKLIKNDI